MQQVGLARFVDGAQGFVNAAQAARAAERATKSKDGCRVDEIARLGRAGRVTTDHQVPEGAWRGEGLSRIAPSLRRRFLQNGPRVQRVALGAFTQPTAPHP